MTQRAATLLLWGICFSGVFAQAREFSTAFISFNLPNNWDCNQEETEWVCKSHIEKSAQEAVIVFTAKEASPTDTLDAFTRHLKMPLNTGARAGGLNSSIIKPVQETIINGQKWIDATHRDSEIKNYFTRYLATVKDGIAIAVTFTSHKDSYTKYSSEFFNAAKSLKVTARSTKLAVNKQPFGNNQQLGQPIEIPGPQTIPVIPDQVAPLPQQSHGTKTKALLFVVAILLAGGALYVLLRTRRS